MKKESFKNQAREHQLAWKAKQIGPEYDKYKTWLIEKDAKAGKNFFDPENVHGLNIFNGTEISVLKRYPNYRKSLMADILRSEHIPFNFFVPFNKDFDFLKNVLNVFLKDTIKTVTQIKIEYAPSPRERYLDDGTAFDVYIEYIHTDGSNGGIGIEVKYTEKSYPLKKKSKEYTDVHNKKSKYYVVSEKSGTFDMEHIDIMIENDFRQLWRNHLLVESVKQNGSIKHASSILLSPKDNDHFSSVCKRYSDLLKQKDSFLYITYESFIDTCKIFYIKSKFNESFKVWLDYLENRYIVS